MPTFPVILAGNRVTAGLLTSMQPVTIVKPTDEPLTSNVTMQNDNDLVLPVVASATYDFDCYLNYEGGTQGASDIKWQWVIPASAALRYTADLRDLAGGIRQPQTFTAAAVVASGTNGAGNLIGASMTGTLVVSSTPGTIQLQWAQNTSSATATIVHAQSSLKLLRTA